MNLDDEMMDDIRGGPQPGTLASLRSIFHRSQLLTHDRFGTPLPSFILSGRVPYFPMPMKEWVPLIENPE